MKKYLMVLFALNLLVSCSDKQEETAAETPVQTKQINLNQMPQIDYADKKFSFKADNLPQGCAEDSEIICAVNQTIKCTINPQFSECDKALMPKFVFMQDESLDRPTEVSYQITKLKPLSGGMLEVYTNSDCNGTWFGLCKGTIIYVLTQQNNRWVVQDIYARQ